MIIIIQEGGWMAPQKDISQFAQDSYCICNGKEKHWLGSHKPMERLDATHKRTFKDWRKKSSLAKKIFLFVLKTTTDQKKPSYYNSKCQLEYS